MSRSGKTENPTSSKEYSLSPFFEQSSDLLCIAGFDGYFKRINPALCKLLGYSKEELFSRPINSFVHPDDQEITEHHRNNIRDGKPLLNFENRYVSKDGDVVWFSWTSIPVPEERIVYAIAKNITHKKKHAEKRNQLISELTQTNEQLKKLNYATSHDLRSPISNLISVFNLLDISSIKDPENRELIRLLKSSTEKLKETLDNYIDDFQNNKALQVSVETLDIMEVLKSVMHSLDSLITDSNTVFNTDLEGFQTVTFNEEYLESVFLNLVSNSIKYAHPKRNPVITIKTVTADGNKQLIFSDNGLGIDLDEAKNKMFKLHQTFHQHSDSKGIGLYLVYNHIISLGGTISVDSEVDEGTTFTITFS